MNTHDVTSVFPVERLDAQIRRWPTRWLVGYLCIVSTVALAAGIASTARADGTAPMRAPLSVCVGGATELHLQGCSR